MELEERTLSTRTIFNGKVISVEFSEVKLPNGNIAGREVVRHSGGAAVLFVSEGKVLLERQFRFPYGKVIWEIPAGKLNSGEDPEAAARRELEEETGYRAEELKKLTQIYPSPGYTDEIIYIYYTERAHALSQHLDEDEFINFSFVPLEECVKMTERGEICDAKTIAALYKYLYENKMPCGGA